MKRLLLIDAYAMIYRAYYAFIRAPRITSKGENTSAIFGFLTTLDDLKRRLQPTHLGVAFDPHGPTFRHEAFEQYKAQREETPEDIRKAVPIIKQILQALRIPALEVPGYEADDVIGTLAGQAEKAGFEVFMATPDKDYGQLVTEHAHMYRPRHTGGFEDLGPKEVCEKYGIESTSQVIDLLGLMGDASDNIPGCNGVGEKTAVKLLQQFGNVEQMLSRTNEIKGAMREKIESQAEAIRFSKFLATIKTDVPITLDEDALIVKEPDLAALTPIYIDLEFRSLLKKYEGEGSKGEKTTRSDRPKEKNGMEPDLFSQPQEPDLFTQGDLFAPAVDLSALSDEDKQAISIAHYLLSPETSHDPEYLCMVYRCKPEELKERVLGELRKDERLYQLYTDVEMPLAPILQEMHEVGVRFDVNILHEASDQMHKELDALEQDIYNLVPEEFRASGVKLNIICQTMAALLDMLKRREVDFVLCFRPNVVDDEIESHALFDNQLSVILSKEHPLAGRESLSLDDIRPQRIAMPARETQARNAFDSMFPGELQRLDVQVEINEVNVLLDLIRATQMITFLSEATLYQKGGLKAIPLEASNTQMEGCVHTLKKVYRKRAADEFIRILSQSNAVMERAHNWLK